MTVADVMDSLQHPKIVEAFLLSPTFTSKLPAGTKLSLQGNYPIKHAVDPKSVGEAKFTWAIVNASEIVAGAIVNQDLTDDEMDALDKTTAEGDFMTYLEGESIRFVTSTGEIGPEDPNYRIYHLAVEGGAVASAMDMKVIISNGPRSLLVGVDPERGLTFSPTFGTRSDGTVLERSTTLYGALVANAFETVITRDAQASLAAAKAA